MRVQRGSIDKGFWSPKNKVDLEAILGVVAMKKKGYSSKANYEYEHSKEFLEAKKGHSAVESAFHALQNYGLEKCHDRDEESFKPYIRKSDNTYTISLLPQKSEKAYTIN